MKNVTEITDPRARRLGAPKQGFDLLSPIPVRGLPKEVSMDQQNQEATRGTGRLRRLLSRRWR
jgi:hypothetical protein